jgi:excisionase family DNA binding protein
VIYTMNEAHMQSETYMNDVEAAAYLGISRSWLTKLRVRGGGPPHVKLGRRCLYRRSDLDGFMRAHLRRTTSEGRKL